MVFNSGSAGSGREINFKTLRRNGFQKRKEFLHENSKQILFTFWTASISEHRWKRFWFSCWTVLLKEIQRNLEIELSLNGDCIRFSTLDVGKISPKTQT